MIVASTFVGSIVDPALEAAATKHGVPFSG